MAEPFILDGFRDKKPSPFKAIRFLQNHQHAKRFRLDLETTQKVRSLAATHADIWLRMRRFAKPPFPEVFVEFTGVAVDDGSIADQFSILWAGDKVVPCRMNGTALSVLPAYAEVREDGFYVKLGDYIFDKPNS